jgi:hypothetical protein
MCRKFWLESLKAGDHSKNLGVCGQTILKLILDKSDLGYRLESSGSRYEHTRALVKTEISLGFHDIGIIS